jgi:uncharacterized protein (DUF885 family)
MHPLIPLAFTAAAALALGLCALPADAAPAEPTDTAALLRRFAADEASALRFWRLRFSPRAHERRRAFLAQWRQRLDALDYEALGSAGRIDWLLLDGHLRHALAQSRFDARREEELRPLLPFAETIARLEEARRGLEPLDPEQAAETLSALTASVKAARSEKRESGSVRPAVALRAATALGESAETLKAWFAHYDGFQPLFSWWCRKPYETASAALDDYAKFLREELAGIKGADDDPLVGDPIGREALEADLSHERIPYTPEALIAIAEREFAWCEAQLKKAAREMGLEPKAALETVKSRHARPGEQEALVVAQAREAIAFVDSRELVSIDPLCRETWRVDMLSAEGQKTLPFAAYGGQKMLVAFPLESMDHATKRMSLRGNNEHFTRIVTPHELIPGHHLQGYMAERHAEWRRPFSTPFLVEGWALHWEMLLWDLGWARGPEDRIGMLFWRMHRCARILVSLRFHLGQMEPAAMVDYLVEKVGHERFTATSEVRRFIGGLYAPLYQCAYMIGGLQMRALWGELKERGWSPRRFHDAVLHQSAIPIDLIRVALTEQRPSKDAPPWRFSP